MTVTKSTSSSDFKGEKSRVVHAHGKRLELLMDEKRWAWRLLEMGECDWIASLGSAKNLNIDSLVKIKTFLSTADGFKVELDRYTWKGIYQLWGQIGKLMVWRRNRRYKFLGQVQD